MHTNDRSSVALVGRILLAFIFLASGLSKIPGWADTAGYMASKGIPFVPLFLFPAIFIECVAGLCVLLGFRTRVAALVLGLYLIPVTLLFHDFWNLGGIERQMQMVNFMKNLSIMGGLLIVSAFGAGAMSVDAWRNRNKKGPTRTADVEPPVRIHRAS